MLVSRPGCSGEALFSLGFGQERTSIAIALEETKRSLSRPFEFLYHGSFSLGVVGLEVISICDM